MDIEKSTKFGSINISLEAIAQIAGKAATECYGVVGMSKRNNSLKDGIDGLLKIENYAKGVYVRKNNKGLIEIDIYIVVGYGLRITETIAQVQKRVKYELEKNLNLKLAAVNVYVQGVQNV